MSRRGPASSQGSPFRIAGIPWTMGTGLAEIGFALESFTSSASTKILFCNICHLPITDLKDSCIQIQSSRRVHLECHQKRLHSQRASAIEKLSQP